MTRTERNESARALLKDRHSRDGLKTTKTSGKQGAGAHNWGSIKDEGLYETQADADAALEENEDGVFELDDGIGALPKKTHPNANDTEAEYEGIKVDPKEFTNGGGGIAHSPSESMSSLDSATSNGFTKGGGQRRMSNVSEDERRDAQAYRERVGTGIRKGSVDLAQIAKTSYGIAQSPPGVFGTSPTKMK